MSTSKMKFFAAFLAYVLLSSDASPLQLISQDGSCRSASQIGSYVSSQAISQTGNMCPVSALIDCTSDSDSSSIINLLFETSFVSNSKGLCLDMNAQGAFIYTSFTSMYSSKFCGSKAADFCGAVSSNIYILVSAKDLTETLDGHDQIFRRIIKKLQINGSPLNSIDFILKVESGDSTVSNQFSAEILDRLSEIWNDIAGSEQALSDRISLKVIVIDESEISSIESLRISHLATVANNAQTASAPDILGSSLAAAWGEIPSGVPRSLLNPIQRQSLLKVEAAYNAGIAQIENAIGHWQVRIGDGKIVGKFGDRVQQLLKSVRKAYNTRTIGTITVRDRAERSRQLEEHLATAVSELFTQQLSNLQSSTIIKFRRSLVKLVASPAGFQPEEEQQALRRALFNLRTATSDLEVESLGLSSATMQSEVSITLQAIATEFPETAAARLEEVRKVEKSTKRPPKTKGQKAVNIGLNLVGMLRPPGFGNLQGFLGYTTGLLGLPLELLLGVQNDGDTPEIMGEDREYPILRLQPKVHFDIDI